MGKRPATPTRATSQPAPGKELVSATVQNIFEKARNQAHQQIRDQRIEDIRKLSISLPPARKTTMTFRYASGKEFKVFLNDHQYTIKHIQEKTTESQLRRSIITATIPGIPEPLSHNQDLRHLLPNIPVIEISLS